MGANTVTAKADHFHTLRHGWSGWNCTDKIFKWIFMNKNVRILLKCPWSIILWVRTWVISYLLQVYFYNWDQAALRTFFFHPSVCPCVHLSVPDTFFTMLLLLHHHEIFNSNYQWHKWCPFKGQDQRSKVKVTKVKTNFVPIGHFWTVTPVWIHQWLRNDAHSLK